MITGHLSPSRSMSTLRFVVSAVSRAHLPCQCVSGAVPEGCPSPWVSVLQAPVGVLELCHFMIKVIKRPKGPGGGSGSPDITFPLGRFTCLYQSNQDHQVCIPLATGSLELSAGCLM